MPKQSPKHGKRKAGGDRPPKFTPAKYAEALCLTGGVMSRVAKLLKCDRTTVYNAIARHPELAQARDEARNVILDEAETGLFLAVKAGDLRAIQYLLDRQGRHRGYGVRTEVTGADGGPIQAELRTVNVNMTFVHGRPDPDRT